MDKQQNSSDKLFPANIFALFFFVRGEAAEKLSISTGGDGSARHYFRINDGWVKYREIKFTNSLSIKTSEKLLNVT